MPKIPVNKDDMPTSAPPMDESLVYRGYIEKCEYGGKNKSDQNFAKLKLKVLEPVEYKDNVVFCNHMPIVSGHEDPFYMFSNFCIAFKVDPNGFDGEGFDPDDTQLIGLEGEFSIENDKDGKYPPRVKEFLSAG